MADKQIMKGAAIMGTIKARNRRDQANASAYQDSITAKNE
jgi:hypothetical protein